jgi:2'-5' RNA ligase
MMRLFIACPIPENIRSSLENIIILFQKEQARVKWVEPKNIHLTLKFLGETDERLVVDISNAIKKVAGNFDPISGFVNNVGAFPNPNRPRVVWAGMDSHPPELEQMALEIDNQITKIGFEKESRKFKSHLTLGRVKDSRQLGGLPSAIKGFQMTPEKIVYDRIILYKSTLTPTGPIYDVLFEAKLSRKERFS